MAPLGDGTSTDFPGALDSALVYVDGSNPGPDDNTRLDADLVNDLLDAVVGIEAELGTDPAGNYGDLKTRLNTYLPLSGSAFTQGSVYFADANGRFAQDNANLFWDDASNRLGIGTTSPDSPLHAWLASAGAVTAVASSALTLENSGDLYLSMLTPNSNLAGLVAGDPDDNDAGILAYNHATDAWVVTAGGTGIGRFIGGSLLIGDITTAPDSLLHLLTATAGVVDAPAETALTLEDDGEIYLSFLTGNTGIAGLLWGNPDDNDVAGVTYDHTTDAMILTAGGSETARLLADGWGFGTASPDSNALHVHKATAGAVTAVANAVAVLENSTDAWLQFLTPNTDQAGLIFGDPEANDIGQFWWDNSIDGFRYYINGTELVRLTGSLVSNYMLTEILDLTQDATGLTPLTVTSTSNATQLAIGAAISYGSNNNPESKFSFLVPGRDSNNHYLAIIDLLNAQTRMLIDASGNIGFGSTTPSAKGNGGTPKILEMSGESGGYALLNLVTPDTAISSTTGAISFISSGLSGGDKRTALIASLKTDAGTVNPTGELRFYIFNGGTPIESMIITDNGGITVGSPTGGSQGAGTINAVGVYDDGALLTSYPLDYAIDGEIDPAKWDAKSASGRHEPARRFIEHAWRNCDIEEFTAYWHQERHLPAMPNPQLATSETKFSIGDMIQRLWETADTQAIHIAALHERLKILENA